MTRSRTLHAFVLALVFGGCSVLNREGPAVTCDDLHYGAINACQDGIIASCLHGKVTYTLCDADACNESFQVPGAYKCGPDVEVPPSDEPMPI